MKPRDVERMLANQSMPEPPDGLAERIKGEIPDNLELPGQRPVPVRSPWARREWRLAAAAAVTLALTGVATWQLRHAGPTPLPAASASEEMVAPHATPQPIPIIMPARRPTPAEAGPPTFPYVREVPTRVRPAVAVGAAPTATPGPAPTTASVVAPLYAGPQPEVAATSETPILETTGIGAPVASPPPETREPYPRPSGGLSYSEHRVTSVGTAGDRLSTFGLEVGSASYAVVSSYLSAGHLPPPEAVRVEELVNAFDYGDRPPERGDFALAAEGAPSPFAADPRSYLLRFAVRAREVKELQRPPAVLTIVVATSESRSGEDSRDLIRRALLTLSYQLGPEDRVGLVGWGYSEFPPTANYEAFRAAVDLFVGSGSSDARKELLFGYRLASRFRQEGATNRVVLCSDELVDGGKALAESLRAELRPYLSEGIELTTIAFGSGASDHRPLERPAAASHGRHVWVTTVADARRALVEELGGTLETVALNAQAEVEFDPAVVARYRLVGYENRDLATRRANDKAADQGEVVAGQAVTALYQVTLQERAPADCTLATLRLRYTPAELGAEPMEVERSVRLSDLAQTWAGASPALRLASLVAEYGEILSSSYRGGWEMMEEVQRRLEQLQPELADNTRVADLARLVATAVRLLRRGGGG